MYRGDTDKGARKPSSWQPSRHLHVLLTIEQGRQDLGLVISGLVLHYYIILVLRKLLNLVEYFSLLFAPI